MADAYVSLKLKLEPKPESNQINNLKLLLFKTFNFQDLFNTNRCQIKGSTKFKSIHDNFKISIFENNPEKKKEYYSLTVYVEGIIPGSKPSKLSFSFTYDDRTTIKGDLRIEMYLFPLDVYILNYFYYTTLGPTAVVNIDTQKKDIQSEKNNSSNNVFFDIANSITDEIVLYNPSSNQRQLDSLYFAALILFLFHESNHISDDLLRLIPTGAKCPFILKNNKNELRRIVLEELRDTKIQLDQLKLKNEKLQEMNKSKDEDPQKANESIKKELEEMNKLNNLQIGIFITQLEKLLFQHFADINLSLNMKYVLSSTQKKGQRMLIPNYTSTRIYLAKLEYAYNHNELRNATKEKVDSVKSQIDQSRQMNLMLSGAKIDHNQKVQDNNQKVQDNNQNGQDNNQDVQDNKFEDILLEVDLSPGWNIDKKDKKDQILKSQKNGNLLFTKKFLSFEVQNSDVKIKIPYKIIDSFTEHGQEFIKQNQNRPVQTKTKEKLSLDYIKSVFCELPSEGELDDYDRSNENNNSPKPDENNNSPKPDENNNSPKPDENNSPKPDENNSSKPNENNNSSKPNENNNSSKPNENNNSSKPNENNNSSKPNENNNSSKPKPKIYSLYIYDGSQLYTFRYFNKDEISKCLKFLEEYTGKKESDLFFENIRRSWKKDQLYILQTESFKRLVTETGTKISKILKNLLNPITYTLSDIIIMQNSCIQREDVAIDTLDQLKKKWKKSLMKSGEPVKKKQLIKVTQKIFTEKVAVSSKRLFKELMDWVDSLQNSYYIMIEWTDVGRKANKMFQKMKNYSMINVHQISPMNAGEFFNKQLIKPYLVKYAQLPEE